MSSTVIVIDISKSIGWLAKTLDNMEEKFAATERPFGYTVDKQGVIRRAF
jgi:hypothetical protein